MTDLFAKNNGESLKEHTKKVLDGVKRLRKMVSNNNILQVVIKKIQAIKGVLKVVRVDSA